MGGFSCIMGIYKQNSFFIMQIDFTEVELETISSAMEDYINYHDDSINEDDLIGGLSVLTRVSSIEDKITNLLLNRG